MLRIGNRSQKAAGIVSIFGWWGREYSLIGSQETASWRRWKDQKWFLDRRRSLKEWSTSGAAIPWEETFSQVDLLTFAPPHLHGHGTHNMMVAACAREPQPDGFAGWEPCVICARLGTPRFGWLQIGGCASSSSNLDRSSKFFRVVPSGAFQVHCAACGQQ